MKFKKWNLPPPSGAGQRRLTQAGIPPLAAAVLCARGVDTEALAADFLADHRGLLQDPFLMKDMDKAVLRLQGALKAGEHIAVYGDYDVDGITSCCLLTHFLRGEGGNVTLYIPDRLEEGYGLNREAIDLLLQQGVTLIVTVDCGITALEETLYAKSLGIDLVITDHHECKETLPQAAAVVDPHRKDCRYPFPHLAGVGVALKVAMAMGGDGVLEAYGDLACIGTVADVMPLRGENRAIVRLGLEQLAHTTRPGLQMLLREAGAEGKPLTASTIGYTLAPRLNAAGRMGCARVAVELLLTEDPLRAEELAVRLCALNRERQTIEGAIYDDCVGSLDREGGEHPALILAAEGWHQGVVGIVASRLSEKYACPTFMICLQDGKGKGSCRSFGGFHLFAALEQCADLLEGFGGHAMAAGFTILEENIPAFRARMEACVLQACAPEDMVSTLDVDGDLEDETLLTQENIDALALLEPHGAGNPRPVFTLFSCTVLSLAEVGGGRHLKLRVRRGARVLDAIYFSLTAGEAGIAPGDKVDLAFTPQMNEFRGSRTVQLQGVDLRPALTRAQAERALYEKFRRGDPLTPWEATALLPSREEFAGLWRYLQGQGATQPVEEPPARLAKNVAHAFHLRETYMRTMVCVQVMDERGLICVEQAPDRLRIRVNPVERKVDLEQSHIIKTLRAWIGD